MARYTKTERKYHYFYKITNLINGHFYYGIHSTDNLDDHYMGSGHALHKAYKMYGIRNFKKEILKTFDSRKDASDYEHMVVSDSLVKMQGCYNAKVGGDSGEHLGTIMMRNISTGEFTRVSKDDERIASGELVNVCKGMVSARDKNGIGCLVPQDEFYTHRNDYTTATEGFVTCYDKNGKYVKVRCGDPRITQGELLFLWKGKKHSYETRAKMSQTHKNRPGNKGANNPGFGTCWVTKDGQNKKVLKKDVGLYLENGWSTGRYLPAKEEHYVAQLKLDAKNVSDDIKSGCSIASIGRKYGVSANTVSRFIRRFNL